MNRFAACLICLATVSALVGTGCATKPVTHTVTSANNGSTVNLATGDFLVVQLESNPSTGYTWQTMDLNSWVIAATKRPNFATSGATNAEGQHLMGAPGTLTLSFRAVESGTSPLKLAYLRHWETNAEAGKTFNLTVVVK